MTGGGLYYRLDRIEAALLYSVGHTRHPEEVMAMQKAYQCDGIGCTEMSAFESKDRFPKTWAHLLVTLPGGGSHSGTFHSSACAEAWLADQNEHVGWDRVLAPDDKGGE